MNVLLSRLIPSWCSGCRITLWGVLTFGFGGINGESSHLLGEESQKYRWHTKLFRLYFQTYVLPNWMTREPTVCPLSFADGLFIASGPTHGCSTEHRWWSHWAVFAPLSVRSRRGLRKRTQMIRDAGCGWSSCLGNVRKEQILICGQKKKKCRQTRWTKRYTRPNICPALLTLQYDTVSTTRQVVVFLSVVLKVVHELWIHLMCPSGKEPIGGV